MHRKRKPESESWLWAKIVTIPACLIVYWSLLFINTAAGNAWTIWAVCGSYGLLVAWLYSVWRLLHLAAWKRDRAIAEELAEQTGPFEPQWEDIGHTEDGFVGTGKLYMNRLTEPVTSCLEVAFPGLQEKLDHAFDAAADKVDTEFELFTHDDLYGGRHERTEVHEAKHFYAGSDDRAEWYRPSYRYRTYETESGFPLAVVPVEEIEPPKADG